MKHALLNLSNALSAFDHFCRAVSDLPGYSEAVNRLHYDAQPLRIIEHLQMARRAVEAEHAQFKADAELGSAVRDVCRQLKESKS